MIKIVKVKAQYVVFKVLKVKEKKSECTECAKKDRLIAIQTITAGIPYKNEEERTSAWKSFYNANLTLEEIDDLTRLLKVK